MKSVAEMFREAAELVNEQFGEADASERLRASMAMVDFMIRGFAEEFNRKRWEQSQELITSPR